MKRIRKKDTAFLIEFNDMGAYASLIRRLPRQNVVGAPKKPPRTRAGPTPLPAYFGLSAI